MRSPSGTGPVEASGLRFGLALGALSMLGPLSIDLYLAAMPEMATAFAVPAGSVQRTLSAFFLGLAAAQIPIGALGDRYGRRRPLLGGLALFTLASIGCVLARDIDQFVVARFFQGVGACTGTASARAIIRDLHSGHAAARLMAFSFLVIGISPVMAPLLGSGLLLLMPWQGLFLVLAAGGVIAMLIVGAALDETLPPERRTPAGRSIFGGYRMLLCKRDFMGWAVAAGLVTTLPFAYVTAAPFLFEHGYGLPASRYTLLLAVNAAMSIATTQYAPTLMRRHGGARLIRTVATAALLATLALAGVAATGPVVLPLFMAWSLLLFGAAGLMLTPGAITALDSVRGGVGAATGLMGTIQLAITALSSVAVSMLPAASALSLLSVIIGALAVIIVIATRPADVPLDRPLDRTAQSKQ